jgi:sulfur carrier protein
MQFQLNGKRAQVPEPLSVRALLERFELQQGRVAVAINTEVVPRSSFESQVIHDGDQVEVIQAVGGG